MIYVTVNGDYKSTIHTGPIEEPNKYNLLRVVVPSVNQTYFFLAFSNLEYEISFKGGSL